MDDLALEGLVARARTAIESPKDICGSSSSENPRYELFNAANSICSQKVRCVLAQLGVAYVNHPVQLFSGQTYLPDYVRLRMLGCRQLGGGLSSFHSGDTSTSSGGCDGAVVPTLIDWTHNSVLVDSKRICLYLDSEMDGGTALRPAALAGDVDDQLTVVDELPNYQLLMGRTPSEFEGSVTKNSIGASFSQKKVGWCDLHLGQNPHDATLVQAYTAKRAKELSAANGLFSPEAMHDAYGRAEAALVDLNEKLSRRRGAWMFGASLTLADLFWGIELLRMKNMGVANFWENGRLPHVEEFFASAMTLPSIRLAVLEWPEAVF